MGVADGSAMGSVIRLAAILTSIVVLLAPFANLVDSDNGWVHHGMPAVLALLLYGVGLGLLANMLPEERTHHDDWRTAAPGSQPRRMAPQPTSRHPSHETSVGPIRKVALAWPAERNSLCPRLLGVVVESLVKRRVPAPPGVGNGGTKWRPRRSPGASRGP